MPDQLQNILEPGGVEVATAAGGARRYRKPLKSFRWRDLESIFSASFEEWSRQKAPRLGASLAFYMLLSIAPLLLVLVSVVGLVLGQQTAQADIISQIQTLVGKQGAAAAQALLEGSRNTTHGILATAFGVLTLLFGASGVLMELRDALNTIWEVPTPELSGLKKTLQFHQGTSFFVCLGARHRFPAGCVFGRQCVDCRARRLVGLRPSGTRIDFAPPEFCRFFSDHHRFVLGHIQILARRSHRMARCRARRGCHLHAIYRWQARSRHLPGQGQLRIHIRGGCLHRRADRLGLLFWPNLFPGS